MERVQTDQRRPLLVVITALLVISAAATTAVFVTRVQSIFTPAARYLPTTGGEPASIQNVLKLQRGLPLYQDPRVPPYYPTTLYNAGFYAFYAIATWPPRLGSGEMVLPLRLVTLALFGFGLTAVIAVGLRRWNHQAPGGRFALQTTAMVSMALITFLGPLPGWWVATVRPDMGGAVFAGFGLLLMLTLGRKDSWLVPAVAGICLAAAWSFKQSLVLIAAGLVLTSLIQRRFRAAALLVLPIGITAAGCLLALGPDYAANVAWATSLSAFTWVDLRRMMLVFLAKGAVPLAVSAIGLISLRGAEWVPREDRQLLAMCWFTTLLGGVAASARNGSEANYFFEFWIVVGLMSMLEVKLLFDGLSTSRMSPHLAWALAPVGLLLLTLAGVDVARLAGLEHYRLGRLRLALDRESFVELDRLGRIIEHTNGEVFCQPALWGLAFNPPLPTVNFDDYDYFHKPAAARGLLRDAGPKGLLARHHYPLVALETYNTQMLEIATAAGYVRQPGWKRIVVLQPPSSPGGARLSRGTVRSGVPFAKAN